MVKNIRDMPLVKFINSRLPIETELGSNLMEALIKNEIPVASSCHGDGVCGKCKLVIHQGLENLSAENETEKNLKIRDSLSYNIRISCQCKLYGDVTVHAPYW